MVNNEYKYSVKNREETDLLIQDKTEINDLEFLTFKTEKDAQEYMEFWGVDIASGDSSNCYAILTPNEDEDRYNLRYAITLDRYLQDQEDLLNKQQDTVSKLRSLYDKINMEY
jgi:hypothetical protein